MSKRESQPLQLPQQTLAAVHDRGQCVCQYTISWDVSTFKGASGTAAGPVAPKQCGVRVNATSASGQAPQHTPSIFDNRRVTRQVDDMHVQCSESVTCIRLQDAVDDVEAALC